MYYARVIPCLHIGAQLQHHRFFVSPQSAFTLSWSLGKWFVMTGCLTLLGAVVLQRIVVLVFLHLSVVLVTEVVKISCVYADFGAYGFVNVEKRAGGYGGSCGACLNAKRMPAYHTAPHCHGCGAVWCRADRQRIASAPPIALSAAYRRCGKRKGSEVELGSGTE